MLDRLLISLPVIGLGENRTAQFLDAHRVTIGTAGTMAVFQASKDFFAQVSQADRHRLTALRTHLRYSSSFKPSTASANVVESLDNWAVFLNSHKMRVSIWSSTCKMCGVGSSR